MIHRLKVYPEFFEQIRTNRKNFEIRKNDRDFQIGDIVILQEFTCYEFLGSKPNKELYTENTISFVIKDILDLNTIFPNYVALIFDLLEMVVLYG